MRRTGVYMIAECKEGCRGYNDCIGKGRPRKRKRTGTGMGRGHEPDMNRLEVGPGYDLLASGVRCVELDRNTQAANSHRSLSAETFDGLQETPSGDGAQLDVVLVQHARSANNTPPVVKALGDRQPLPQRNDEFVREDRVEELLDPPSVGLG